VLSFLANADLAVSASADFKSNFAPGNEKQERTMRRHLIRSLPIRAIGRHLGIYLQTEISALYSHRI